MKKLSIYIFILSVFLVSYPMQAESQSLLDKVKTELKKTGGVIKRNIKPNAENQSLLGKIKTELKKTGDVIKRNINPNNKSSSGPASENASNAGKSHSGGGSNGGKQHKQKFLQTCKKDETAVAKKIDCSCAAKKFSKKYAKKLKEFDAEIAKSKNPEQANIHKKYRAKFIKESTKPGSADYQSVLAQSMKVCMFKK